MAFTFLDFFAGVGGFRKGLENVGAECKGFCEFDKFAVASYTSIHLITDEQREYLATLDKKKRQKEILKEEYRNGEWYAQDVRNIDIETMPKVDCWCFGFPCFVAGTLITTSEGLKPIEEIKAGDMVLTHKNRYRKVLIPMVNKKKGIYRLKVQGSPETYVTGNHRFYVRYKSDIGWTDSEWVAVENFIGNEYIVIPNDNGTSEYAELVECSFDADREEFVYNMEVEEDHSYTANGMAAHNCQDISVAGKQKGLEGERSGLFYAVTDIIRKQKEEDRPKYLFIENVKNLLSINGGWDFFKVLLELDEIGYDAEWQVE